LELVALCGVRGGVCLEGSTERYGCSSTLAARMWATPRWRVRCCRTTLSCGAGAEGRYDPHEGAFPGGYGMPENSRIDLFAAGPLRPGCREQEPLAGSPVDPAHRSAHGLPDVCDAGGPAPCGAPDTRQRQAINWLNKEDDTK